MLKSFKTWIKAMQEAENQELFERGYGYACTELLLHNRDPIEGTIDRNYFDKGVDKAILDVSLLRSAYNDAKADHRLSMFVEPEQENDSLAGITFSPWAKWVAQDEDGEWCEYLAEPEPDETITSHGLWSPGYNDSRQWGRLVMHAHNPNWKQTKRKIDRIDGGKQ